MKLINTFGLKNYRVFDNSKGFMEEFTSINLLTGSNNSGKSSIVKALQMLKNSIKESKYPFSLDLKKQEHLLGDFDNLLFDKENRSIEIILPYTFFGLTNFSISLLFEALSEKKGSYNAVLREFQVVDKKDNKILYSFVYRKATEEEEIDYKIDFEKRRAEEEEELRSGKRKIRWGIPPRYSPLVGYIEWSINLDKIRENISSLKEVYNNYLEDKVSWRGQSLEELDKITRDHGLVASLFINCFKEDLSTEEWDAFLTKLSKEETQITGKAPIEEDDFISEEDFIEPPKIEDLLYYQAKEILSKNLQWEALKENKDNYRIIEDYFMNSWENLVQRISAINYISAIKEENVRSYNASSNSPFVDLLKRFEVVDMNSDFVKKYLEAFEIGREIQIEINPKYQSILVSITTLDDVKRDLVDFGYGIKQLILIIMQISVLAHENTRNEYGYDDEYYIRYAPSLLIIEEPESNLHPKWQSLLADMFTEASNKFNIQIIIETHSEYLIRKFQTLVAEKKLKQQDVKILYLRGINQTIQGKKQIENVLFGDDGSIDFKIFDGGFFDENYKLELSLLNIQRDSFLTELKKFKQSLVQNKDTIDKLQTKIDEFVKEKDITVYRQSVLSRFDISKLSGVSVDYLISGQFLLGTNNGSVDYSPVIIQYGRVIENELKQIFQQIKPNATWLFGKMQASMEKKLLGSTLIKDCCNNKELNLLGTILQTEFKNTTSLKVNLLDNLRNDRNSAAHPGQTKTKQEALDYIQKANDFLDSWILEKK